MRFHREVFLTAAAIVAMLLILVAASYAATDYYVDGTNGDDGNDGESWGDAFATIQAGIDACNTGSSSDPDTVRVAAGNYSENIELDDNIALLGGYPPGGGTRNTYQNKTIIDGSKSNSVVRVLSKQNVAIDGFTIQNGSATFGGGIIYDESSGEILGNRIKDNCANHGGGICCYNCSPSIYLSNTIQDNVAADNGGGIYCYGSSSAIGGNYIWFNLAGQMGGGIYCENSSPKIGSHYMAYNEAPEAGGGICCFEGGALMSGYLNCNGNWSKRGGGIYVYNNQTEPVSIEWSWIAYNDAIYGGGIMCEDVSNISISGLWLEINDADFGGGIYLASCDSPTLSHNRINQNRAIETASGSGGGIYLDQVSNVILLNNLVTANEAASMGAGIACFGSTPVFQSCTIAHNSAGSDGSEIYTAENSASEMINSIIWGSSAEGFYLDGSSSFDISFSCIRGGWAGEGNIADDPLFVPTNDPPHTCYLAHTGPQAGDSPCLDAGRGSTADYGIPSYRTTCTDGGADGDDDGDEGTGPIDMGYHYGDGYAGNGDTYIELVSFEARATGNQIVLTWETGAEIDNAGFVIYRTVGRSNDYKQLSDLIPANGSPASGASYRLIDSDVEPGVTYYYWLVDIDTSGEWTAHGPRASAPVNDANALRRPLSARTTGDLATACAGR